MELEIYNVMPKVLLVELDSLKKVYPTIVNAVTHKVATITEWKRDLTMDECQALMDFIHNEKANMELEQHFSNVRKEMVKQHPLWYWQ